MNTGLYRIELGGLGSSSPGRPESTASRYLRSGLLWGVSVALIAAFGTWALLPGYASKPAGSAPILPATAPSAEPAPSSAAVPVPEQTAPLDGLKILSQSWRRGGLGSNALVTFTLRNSNEYAVKDIEIACAFNRRDGSHLTDRTRTVHDVVKMKSRKTFARLHVGFVNVHADRAKCSLLAVHYL